MARIAYSDEDIAAFLEVAAELGITRAKRQLGYPAAWNTAKRWVDAAGISVPLDSIKAQSAAHWDWYKAEDMLIVIKEGMLRAVESLQDQSNLSADDQKKLAEAVQKYVNTALLLEGKATSISESRRSDTMDVGLAALLAEEEARNRAIEQGDDITHE